MGPWDEDVRFWEIWAPYLFDSNRIRDASVEADQLIALLGLPAGAAVLDVCCGPGRHMIELARRGFRVAGIDRVSSYLSEAQRRAEAEGHDIKLYQADVRDMRFDAEYDAAINMFSSLGYHRDESDDIAVVSNVCRALKPTGKFIIETDGREVLARKFKEREWYRHEDGTISLHERRVVDDWELLESRWILLRDGAIVWEGNIVQRIYSGLELRRLLQRAGFGKVVLYGGLDGSRYDQSARRLVAVAISRG